MSVTVTELQSGLASLSSQVSSELCFHSMIKLFCKEDYSILIIPKLYIYIYISRLLDCLETMYFIYGKGIYHRVYIDYSFLYISPSCL